MRTFDGDNICGDFLLFMTVADARFVYLEYREFGVERVSICLSLLMNSLE